MSHTGSRALRVGLVCPYSLDVPGGVQRHVLDLAEHLRARGHVPNVLAPATKPVDQELVTSAGRAVGVPFNGSIARINFGPRTRRLARQWLEAGKFDIVHVHEPSTPSLSLIALQDSTAPVIATFHTALRDSRLLRGTYSLLGGTYRRLAAGIAVSAESRRTVVEHLGGDPIVVPNGVSIPQVQVSVDGKPRQLSRSRSEWQGTPDRPTIAVLGRMDEPRKGLNVLLTALPALRHLVPGVRVLVAGEGHEKFQRRHRREFAGTVEVLGRLNEPDKYALLSSVDLLVAPHTGGESFGIVIVEALAHGARVVASALDAFVDVLGEHTDSVMVPVGDAQALALAVASALREEHARSAEERSAAREARRQAAEAYRWDAVTDCVESVYHLVVESAWYPPGLWGQFTQAVVKRAEIIGAWARQIATKEILVPTTPSDEDRLLAVIRRAELSARLAWPIPTGISPISSVGRAESNLLAARCQSMQAEQLRHREDLESALSSDLRWLVEHTDSEEEIFRRARRAAWDVHVLRRMVNHSLLTCAQGTPRVGVGTGRCLSGSREWGGMPFTVNFDDFIDRRDGWRAYR
ncbi:glycosyltransferase family 4 protein [Devriesea agamarum]|uniref:glycosyltransferase family 4 protein n=1 Tax=Devriesea agamarum TaxID=472569 RepID=UPI00071E288F|nr:glycosyltransferase family 4 protein [Devriesea agamarum]